MPKSTNTPKAKKKLSHASVADFFPKSKKELESWFEQNFEDNSGIWIVLPKKGSGIPGLTVDELIDEALCWGWIDSLPRKIDETKFKLYVSPRSPKSNWSKVNKEKVVRLEKDNRIRPSGKSMIELAKKTGTWTALDSVEALEIPEDLKKELEKNSSANAFFSEFPRSAKRGILEWIAQAKKPETRTKRIMETVSLAKENKRANQFLVGKEKTEKEKRKIKNSENSRKT